MRAVYAVREAGQPARGIIGLHKPVLDFFFRYRCAQVLSPLLLLLLDLLLLLLLDLLLLLAADADARAVATPMDVGGATSSESSCELRAQPL